MDEENEANKSSYYRSTKKNAEQRPVEKTNSPTYIPDEAVSKQKNRIRSWIQKTLDQITTKTTEGVKHLGPLKKEETGPVDAGDITEEQCAALILGLANRIT